MNRNYFIARVKRAVFGNRIGQSQIDGLNRLLDVREQRFPRVSIYELAYILATIFHETGAKMQPVREKGGSAYFTRMYDIRGSRPEVAKRLGNVNPGDGAKFYGRGDVQNTGRDNARKAGIIIAQVLGVKVDFEKNPDLLLNPLYSAILAFYGMIHGSYTGKKLADYITDEHQDFVGARHIINGSDRAKLIAGYAESFLDALQQASEEAPSARPVGFLSVPADGGPVEGATEADQDDTLDVLDGRATGKKLTQSKTAWAAGAAGIAGVVGPASEVVDKAQTALAVAQQSTDVATGAWELAKHLGPWVIAIVAIAIAVGVIIHERRRHSLEFGV